MTHHQSARLLLLALIVTVAAVGAMQGCGEGIRLPFGLGSGGGGDSSNPTTPQQTTDLIRFMAVVPFMLGLGAMIAAIWLPILVPFKRMATALIALGIILAVLPWVLDISALPLRVAMWAALVFATAWAGATLWFKLAAMRRISQMNHELNNGSTEEQKVKLASGIAALTRTINPAVDKAFKAGEMTASKLVENMK